jgi:hypothetical protein
MKFLRRDARELYRVYGEEEFLSDRGPGEWNTRLHDHEQIEEVETDDWSELCQGLDELPIEETLTDTPEDSASGSGPDGYRAAVGSARGRVTGVVLLTVIAGAVIGIIVVHYVPPSHPGLGGSISGGPADGRPVISTVGHQRRSAGVHLRRPLAASEGSRRIVGSGSLRGLGRSGSRDTRLRTAVGSADFSGADAQPADSSSAVATRVADGAYNVARRSGSEFGFER